MNIVICTRYDWGLRWPGAKFISAPEDLTLLLLRKLNPRYIFFTHWSWKIPSQIHERYECIGFHMTDLPYGRGGSPLQNLILRGHTKTKMTAFRITEEMDAGPIYLKRRMSLSGKAETIYRRGARIIKGMIREIIAGKYKLRPQTGEVVTWPRVPESACPLTQSYIPTAYDYIRCVDAPSYRGFTVLNPTWNIIFTNARIKGGKVYADAVFEKR